MLDLKQRPAGWAEPISTISRPSAEFRPATACGPSRQRPYGVFERASKGLSGRSSLVLCATFLDLLDESKKKKKSPPLSANVTSRDKHLHLVSRAGFRVRQKSEDVAFLLLRYFTEGSTVFSLSFFSLPLFFLGSVRTRTKGGPVLARCWINSCPFCLGR